MRLKPAALAIALFAALAVPAIAQQSPEGFPMQYQNGPQFTPTPSPALVAAGDRAENPAVTSVARAIYAELAAGKMDRTHLTPEMQRAWSAALETSASQELSELGTPQWSFVRNTLAGPGLVSIYQLSYAKTVLYMSVGVAGNGAVYDLQVGSQLAPEL
jgi:hypothetical protein